MATKRAPAPMKRTLKSRELKLYQLKRPDFFDKAVAAYSEAEARKTIGADVELIEDSKLMRKAKRRPGAVFQKLAGMKKDWAVWE